MIGCMQNIEPEAVFDQIVVVLQRPQNPLNIGGVLRAMKNLGFRHLRLVEPAPFVPNDLLRMAHRANDLLAQMSTHATVDEALHDAIFVVGAAGCYHPGLPHTGDVRALAAGLVQRSSHGKIALLFGTEVDGLDRAALARCHLLATLPVEPEYASLNLAQAVLLFLYELRLATFAGSELPAPVPPQPAQAPPRQELLARLFQNTESALDALGFFKGNRNPAPTMHALRQMVYRAQLTQAEVALLLAVVQEMEESGKSRR
jgi:tRNA/rRNA methyltransferase